jgi:dolichol kinase
MDNSSGVGAQHLELREKDPTRGINRCLFDDVSQQNFELIFTLLTCAHRVKIKARLVDSRQRNLQRLFEGISCLGGQLFRDFSSVFRDGIFSFFFIVFIVIISYFYSQTFPRRRWQKRTQIGQHLLCYCCLLLLLLLFSSSSCSSSSHSVLFVCVGDEELCF